MIGAVSVSLISIVLTIDCMVLFMAVFYSQTSTLNDYDYEYKRSIYGCELPSNAIVKRTVY